MLCNSESSFKKHLKTFLFNTCFYAAWLTPPQRLWSLLVMALYKYVYDYDYVNNNTLHVDFLQELTDIKDFIAKCLPAI